MTSEMANHGLGELDVVGSAHGDGVLVGAGLEGQLELVDQRVIEDGGDAEKPADGRLSADLAFGEEILQGFLVGELGVVGAQLVAELFEVDVIGSGQGAEDELAVGLDEDGFDDPLPGAVLPHEADPHPLEIGTKIQHGPPCWRAKEILFREVVACQCFEQVFNWRAGGALGVAA